MFISDSPNNLESKKSNRNRVYEYIYSHSENISKQDLVQQLNISLPTVNLILKSLKDEQLISTAGTLASNGGRRPNALKYNANYRYSIGLDISNTYIHFVIINLGADIIYKKQTSLKFEYNDHCIKELSKLIQQTLETLSIASSEVLGIGIAVPGTVHEDNFHVSLENSLDYMNIDISLFNRHLPFPCLFYNHANSGCIAEFWKTSAEESVFYLSLDNHVTGAILLNNSLYRGTTQKSAEIAHTTLVPGGRLCSCGKRGCTDAYLSTLLLTNSTNDSLSNFFNLLKAKSAYHTNIWNEYLHYLTITINNLRMLFDCPIIIGGHISIYLDRYLKEIKHLLSECNPYNEQADYIRLSHFQDSAAAIGAALLHVRLFIQSI